MIDALIYGFAIVGVLTVFRFCWHLGKALVALARLRRAVLRVQKIRRANFDEAVRRGLVQTPATESKEETEAAN